MTVHPRKKEALALLRKRKSPVEIVAALDCAVSLRSVQMWAKKIGVQRPDGKPAGTQHPLSEKTQEILSALLSIRAAGENAALSEYAATWTVSRAHVSALARKHLEGRE